MHRKTKFSLFMILILLLSLCAGCSVSTTNEKNNEQIPANAENMSIPDGELQVHFIDVGQGDATLIQSPGGENILIDGGEKDAADDVMSLLKAQGIEKIDVLIATHPHSDHIGGLVTILKNYPVERFYMPEVVHTTNTFDQLLDAVQQQGIKISGAKCGVEIPLKGVKAEFLAPNAEDYENLNDYSAVLKLTYGEQAFLFTGDAQELSENEMLANGKNLQASVLKIGHHGSSSSSSAAFLQAVSPQIAIISCGAQNDYGHPHKEVLQRLSQKDLQVLRTDLHGSITIKTDGKSLTPCVRDSNGQKAWIGNKNSRVVHNSNCSNLPHPKNRIYFDSLDEAYQLNYKACPNCISGGN